MVASLIVQASFCCQNMMKISHSISLCEFQGWNSGVHAGRQASFLYEPSRWTWLFPFDLSSFNLILSLATLIPFSDHPQSISSSLVFNPYYSERAEGGRMSRVGDQPTDDTGTGSAFGFWCLIMKLQRRCLQHSFFVNASMGLCPICLQGSRVTQRHLRTQGPLLRMKNHSSLQSVKWENQCLGDTDP